MKRSYSTDLSDAQWQCLEAHVAALNKHGRPWIHGSRMILDAVFYIVRGGCAWRLLPHEFSSWKSVYHYFRF